MQCTYYVLFYKRQTIPSPPLLSVWHPKYSNYIIANSICKVGRNRTYKTQKLHNSITNLIALPHIVKNEKKDEAGRN